MKACLFNEIMIKPVIANLQTVGIEEVLNKILEESITVRFNQPDVEIALIVDKRFYTMIRTLRDENGRFTYNGKKDSLEADLGVNQIIIHTNLFDYWGNTQIGELIELDRDTNKFNKYDYFKVFAELWADKRPLQECLFAAKELIIGGNYEEIEVDL